MICTFIRRWKHVQVKLSQSTNDVKWGKSHWKINMIGWPLWLLAKNLIILVRAELQNLILIN